ncbi:hypothetical protein EUGRSUZ_I01645 [Eucalyptus grandis]|uniref:Uncharacterized protein n=2 Tax=Eucalyptus grandis TaxID=71139 RepID=A0ACC3JG20_EUCGR|nr:hypothetical protein EUGRSUZ_I01645 [Eucalyptus grandis]
MASSGSQGMLSEDQLLHLFDRFSVLTSLPDVKKRISDAVQDRQEAVAVTTEIQEEIFQEMGIEPRFGIACLGRVNMVYENDRDLMIRFYKFVAKEEAACDEAEFGPDEFSERMVYQQKLQEQLRQQLEIANFDGEASVSSPEQIQETVRRRVSPLFTPRGAS